jgi:Flp pilus assembly protein TadD
LKSFRNCVLLLSILVFAAQGNLSRWLQDIEATSRLESVFFKSVALPSGAVVAKRSPAEARAELGKLILAGPSDAELYALRALQAEQQLDFVAAETDWKKHVDLASNKTAAQTALADFYHRRLQPREELAALTAAGLHQRAVDLVEAQGLDRSLAADQFKSWVRRDSKDQAVYAKALEYLNRNKLFAASEEVLSVYKQNFAPNSEFAVRTQADIEYARGNAARAAEIWDQSFDPLWPSSTLSRYFEVVGSGKDRQLLGRLQAEAAARPNDLIAAAKLHHLQQRLNNAEGSRRALLEFRTRKQSWTPAEWLTLARLLEGASLHEEAGRSYHALYLLDPEQGLTNLSRMLLDMPEQPLALGAGDLSLYRDVAGIDHGPGFLNGVLSLILNSSEVSWQYDRQNQAARAYFHRAKAAELLDLLDKRFPNASQRAVLHARLIQSYAVYGDREGVIRAGRQFLQSFPQAAAERSAVTFLLADAYAATGQVNEELAAYDSLLKELGDRAGNLPIGSLAEARPGATAAVRSPEYARVLDRYVSRLVALKRLQPAVAVYRQELGRNANDPGLYERFAAFLDQNKLGGEVEQVYRQAFQKFNNDTFSHKLARWYLRAKQTAQFEALTRDVTKTFSGTSLERYFGAVVASGPSVAPALYLQLNLYAHQRFPHNAVFVNNLLRAYETRGTADAAAYERLLRQHWFESDDLRARFFQLLSRTGRLQAELDSIRALNAKPEENPVAGVLLAEGEIWRTRYEAAAPALKSLAAVYPAEASLDSRAATLHRSLGDVESASSIEANLAKAAPRDSGALTRLGEMQADRERFTAAKPHWDKIPEIEPGKSEGFIEAATIYWDYFQFDEALRTINNGRRRLNNGSLAAFEAAVIHENQRDYGRAIDEYVRGALSEEDERSKGRLLRLARRPALASLVEQRVTAAAANREDLKAVDLRVAMLESQNRRAELETFLANLVNRTSSPEVLARAESVATLNAMRAVERRAMERRIELAPDAVERLRARLQFMRFLEARGEASAAAQLVEDAYRQNPASLGVIRTAVNFHSRNNNGKRAVAILNEAAGRAKGAYPESFRYEAARKSIELGEYAGARALMDALLSRDPYRADYLATVADIFVRQGDDAGLKAFYTKTMETLRAATLSADDRVSRIASLRRNLIPVLTRQKDFNGAVDQYIEIINRFAEDESLVGEAAVYAHANGMNAKLLAYYTKAAGDSPRDYRWPLVLSRVQGKFGDLPGSLASLAKATAIRPDRLDLMQTRAKLEERTLRFDDALQSYQKIYELSYRDPSWMIRVAEQHVRMGRIPQAVAALKLGYIDSQPDQLGNYTRVAQQLLEWNLLKEAQEFANKSAPELQAELAVRLRQPLTAQMPASAVGSEIAIYYTPKEKAELAPSLRGERGLEIARAAKLKDVEVARLYEAASGKEFYTLVNLQRERGRFDELGQQLEAIGRNPARAGENAEAILRESARAFQQGGNTAGELRVLGLLASRGQLASDLLSRYAILMVRQPQQQAVTAAAGGAMSDSIKDALASASLFAPKPADAFAILAARGRTRPPVWTRAYTALAGVYLGAAKDPQVKSAFEGLLGSQSIGEQLARKPDRTLQLTGKEWFYYAGRYGQNVPGAEDYALADLEGSPATAALYMQLGDVYLEKSEYAKAQAEFDSVLELQPKSAEAMRKLALTIYAQGRREEALAAWRRAMQSDQADLPALLQDLALARQIEALRPELDQAIRNRLRRNGGYEAAALLQPIAADLQWLLELATSAPDPEQILESLFDADWLTPAQREAVLEAAVNAAGRKVQSSLGELRGQAVQSASRWHLEQSREWLTRREFAKAHASLDRADNSMRLARADEYEELGIRIAAAEGKFEPLMDRYRNNPESAPSLETMQRVAGTLEEQKDSNTLLEYAYQRELDQQRPSAAVLLGLAKIRLQRNQVSEALPLLKRMNDSIGEPFSTTALAADLLLEQNRPQEAREYIDSLMKAKPWNAEARLLAARGAGSSEAMKAIAESSDVPYATRVEAALAIRQRKGPALQTNVDELNLLSAQPAVTEAQASASPYTFALRRLAAAQTQDANARFRLQVAALAIRPSDAETRRDVFRAAMESRRFAAAANFIERETASIADLKLLTDAYLRQGRNDEAVEAASRLMQLRATGARRLLELARGAQELQRLNEQRMPVFQENYDQVHIVQPRLAALPKSPALGGLAQ